MPPASSLTRSSFDAEYIHADIGWEYWCKEGNPLPDRTIDILKDTDCALFGAITSKPREEAHEELDESLKDKGLVYFSPIVKLATDCSICTPIFVPARPTKATR